MSIDQAALIRAIYDTIFAAYTQPPAPGLPAANQPEDLFLTLEWPGQQLDPSQFSNPWSPQNLGGSPLATEFFSNLVNPIPALSATYRDSGVTVEEMYHNILLLAAVDPLPNGELNPLKTVFNNARQTFDFSKLTSSIDPLLSFHPSYAMPGNWYDEAASKSWAKVTIRSSQLKSANNSPFNQLGGAEQASSGVWKIPAKTVDSIDPEQLKRLKRTLPAEPVLRSRIQAQAKQPSAEVVDALPDYSQEQLDYLANKEDYDNAVANLNANRFQFDLSDPAQQQQWAQMAPGLEATVQAAWSKLQQSPKVDVEAVKPVAVLRKSGITRPDLTGPVSIDTVGSVLRQPGVVKSNLDRIQLNPRVQQVRFNDDPQQLQAIEVSRINFPRQKIDVVKTVPRTRLDYDVLKRYLKIKDDNLDRETSDLQISFRFCRVAIRRSWLLLSILKLAGWRMASQSAGSLSSGRIDNNPGSFPLLPTAFIAIRDLEIRGTWSQKDRTIAEMATSGSGVVGFGPFALSGKYGSDQAGATFTAKFDGQTLSASGLQILGWINQVIPYSPPLD